MKSMPLNLHFKEKPRVCGPCTECCRTMGVQEGDFHKRKDEWCQHAHAGRGCAIYETRPTPCRDFTCLWLTGWGDLAHRPDKIHGVLTATADGQNWTIHEHSGYEGHARRVLKPYIDQWVARGLEFYVIVVCGTKRAFLGDARTFERLRGGNAPEVVGASDVTITPRA